MPLNIESLDDAMLTDVSPNFTGGQNSFGPPDQIPQMAAQYLTNVDIVDGTATTRRGTETLGIVGAGQINGIFWHDTPSFERLMAVVGNALKYYNGSSWVVVTGYNAFSLNGQVCMCQLVDKLYLADGGIALTEYDGTNATSIGAAPKGRFIITSYGQIWMAGDDANPDTLSRSALLDGATWDSTNNAIRIGGGEGDPITGIAEWDDYRVAVFKRNSIYLVQANPATTNGTTPETNFSNATVTKLSDTIGCVSHRSIARVGNDLWFLSDDGVFSLGRVIADNQREIKQAQSAPVQDVIYRINFAAAENAAGFFWNNRYLLALPLDNETTPSSTLVFNTKRSAWSGLWEGWGPLCWALSRPNGLERLDFGRFSGEVWRWLDYVSDANAVETTYQDVGALVPTSIVSRAMIFNDPFSPKSLLNLSVEFFKSQANASVAVQLDESEPLTLNSTVGTSSGVLLLPFLLPATLPNDGVKRRAFGCQHIPPFRSVQAVIRSDQDKLSLRAVLLTGFSNTIVLQQE